MKLTVNTFEMATINVLFLVSGIFFGAYAQRLDHKCPTCPRLHTTHEEQAQVRGIMNGLNAKVEKGKR